jgi:hypothetical protein
LTVRAIVWLAVLPVLLLAAPTDAAGLRLGGGVHYLRTVGDIKDDADFDENSLGFLGSLMLPLPLVRVEGIVEWIPDYGGQNSMIQPQAWALLGTGLYAGVGVGIGYSDGEWQENEFWALRAGLNLPLGGLDLDGFATYRIQSTAELEGLGKKDLDAVTFGAILRFS